MNALVKLQHPNILHYREGFFNDVGQLCIVTVCHVFEKLFLKWLLGAVKSLPFLNICLRSYNVFNMTIRKIVWVGFCPPKSAQCGISILALKNMYVFHYFLNRLTP